MQDKGMWSYHNPVRIVSSTLDSLDQYVNGSNILLVTTPGFVRRGVADRIRQILITKHVTVWEGVKPNPDLIDLDQATIELRDCKFDCVIGLGGGSAIDAAKVLATTLQSSDDLSLQNHFRHQTVSNWTTRLPLIAIPTTAGTGAEVTPFATVWDHVEHKKYSLAGNFVFPDLALLDHNLTLTLSRNETLYPALDAISHALESLWNKNSIPISRAYAFQALKILNEALPKILLDSKDSNSRKALQVASMLSGLAISHTRTAIAHSISYTLTSHYGVPHGLACSFTLSELLKTDIETIAENNAEHKILDGILHLLVDLKLANEITEYLHSDNASKIASLIRETDRASNYSGKQKINIVDLIERSI